MSLVNSWQQNVSADLVKAAQEAETIATAKYPFTVSEVYDTEQREFFENQDGSTVKNPLFGKPVGRIQVTLYGVGKSGYDPIDGKNRSYFFNVCPETVYDANGNLVTASKLAAHMIKTAKTDGQPFMAAVDFFKSNKGRVSISKSQDGTRNYTNGISLWS